MSLLNDFGTAVRLQRKRLGLSQEDLAYKAGLDRTYVSGIERGCRNPSLLSIERLALALNIDLDVLFKSTVDIGRSSMELDE